LVRLKDVWRTNREGRHWKKTGGAPVNLDLITAPQGMTQRNRFKALYSIPKRKALEALDERKRRGMIKSEDEAYRRRIAEREESTRTAKADIRKIIAIENAKRGIDSKGLSDVTDFDEIERNKKGAMPLITAVTAPQEATSSSVSNLKQQKTDFELDKDNPSFGKRKKRSGATPKQPEIINVPRIQAIWDGMEGGDVRWKFTDVFDLRAHLKIREGDIEEIKKQKGKSYNPALYASKADYEISLNKRKSNIEGEMNALKQWLKDNNEDYSYDKNSVAQQQVDEAVREESTFRTKLDAKTAKYNEEILAQVEADAIKAEQNKNRQELTQMAREQQGFDVSAMNALIQSGVQVDEGGKPLTIKGSGYGGLIGKKGGFQLR